MNDFVIPDRRGLVGEWLLNGSSVDTSGNGYDGTASNVTYSKTDRGYQTYKGVFNGTSSQVTVPITHTGERTISFVSTQVPGTSKIIFDSESTGQYVIANRFNNWQMYDGSWKDFGVSPKSNVPESVCLIFRTSTCELYVDGEYKSTVAYSPRTISGTTNIGNWYTGGGGGFDGKIQSFRIFNRVLSETEIRNWYLESLRALGGSTLAGLMDVCVAQINTTDGNELSDIVGGVAVTKTSGTATTDNLGYTRAITNPNYSWPSVTYTTGYVFEDLGSGWVLTQSPSGLSATGINRTTTLREIFLFNRTLSTDEKNALETLCKLDYVLPFDGPIRYSLPTQLKEGCVLFIPGEVSGTTSYDASGNSNHGTLVNSPTKTRGALHGYEGLKFNGTSQSVTLPNITGVMSFTASIFPTANTKTILNLGGGNTITLNASNQIATTGLTGVSISVNGSTVNSVNLNQWNVVTVSFDSVNLSSASLANSSFVGTMANVVMNNRSIDFDSHRLSRGAFFIP